VQHGHVIISASSSASPAFSAFSRQFLVMQGLVGRTTEKEDQPTATRSHELEPRKHKPKKSITVNWMLHCHYHHKHKIGILWKSFLLMTRA
jgi:hypothetical protein